MAKILEQGTKTLDKKIGKFLPSLEELQVGTRFAKKLGALPTYLASALAKITADTSCKIDSDGFGWYFPVTEQNERVSLTIAIVSELKVCIYERLDKDFSKEQNSNLGIDAIGSKGYAVNGLYDKVPEEAWNCRIKSAKWSRKVAYEVTNGESDYRNVIMPVLLIEIEDNPLQLLETSEITNPTCKMQVVIDELS